MPPRTSSGRELVRARAPREVLDPLGQALDATGPARRGSPGRSGRPRRATPRCRGARRRRCVSVVALERGVERRELAQRRRSSRARRSGRYVSPVARARGLDADHVGLDDRRAGRRGLQRLQHVRADRLAHARERAAARPAPAAGRRAAALGRARSAACASSAAPARRAGTGSRCASAAPRPPRAAVLDEREHVLLAHAAAAAGALDLLEVDVVLGGDPHHDRRVAPGAVAARAARWACRVLGRVALQLAGLAGASSAAAASLVPPRAAFSLRRAPRPAWRRWRSAPARCRRRRSCRPRRGSPARARWPATRRRCRSCRSRSRR